MRILNCIKIGFVVIVATMMCGCQQEDLFTSLLNESEQEVADLVGTMKYNEQTDNWQFVSEEGFASPFVAENGVPVAVDIENWDPKFEEYKDGCLVQGDICA